MTSSQPSAAMQCPASMCPLVAPNGSPWTGEYAAPCPGHDDLDAGGCPWWTSCSQGGPQGQVDKAADAGGRAFVVGPNRPRRQGFSGPRTYDCDRASVCRWQEIAVAMGGTLCLPRNALARGMDPRVCMF